MSNQEKIVHGINIDELPPAPVKKVAEVSRKVAAQGAVLIKNDKSVLPFLKGEKISIFGRAQFEYLKSGTGSGGMVNTEYAVGLFEGLSGNGTIEIDSELADIYREFIEKHPFDNGSGWGNEPWSQEEMPLTDSVAESASKRSDKALIVISRLCGESRDNTAEEGSYYLQKTEYEMIKTVKKHFDKVCVALNVGNIIDCSWIDELGVDSVIYIWQGGQEGGNAVADVLCGNVTPSGKLSATIAKAISDFPSDANFGAKDENIYQEDIYVGYRYFETFSKDSVLYPFGFGLSYTKFDISYGSVLVDNGTVSVKATVKNIGEYSGAEVVQIYYEAPQGVLGNPLRQLCAFSKTSVLNPNESCTVCMSFDINDMASYDDSGATGHKSAYILDAGEYKIYAGTDVRSASLIHTVNVPELKVVEQLEEVLAPVKNFERLKPLYSDGKYIKSYVPVPTRTVNLNDRIKDNLCNPIALTGDKGYKLVDVANGDCSMEDFIAQLSPEELACLFMGEGMCSPKVKSGTGGAIGGVTTELLKFGIPLACVTDGPSGLRFDSGEKATSMPCGTLLACTWDPLAVEELFMYHGMECYCYGVDGLLGPGMNILRHPLNGRNFEYFSEDPYHCGKFAEAVSKGLQYSNVTATIKHFACNNQEFDRISNDSVVSERALREIYLKGFEIAAKSGYPRAIMTSYNLINGIHTSSNYDLCTTVLRKEWGYDGVVMTDWWTYYNDDNAPENTTNKKALVRSQNDLSMCVNCAKTHDDNIMESYNSGDLTLYEMQRNAKNILQFLIESNALDRFLKSDIKFGFDLIGQSDKLIVKDTVENVENMIDYELKFNKDEPILLVITANSPKDSLVQIPLNIYNNSRSVNSTFTINGTSGNIGVFEHELLAKEKETKLRFEFNTQELEIKKIVVMQEK